MRRRDAQWVHAAKVALGATAIVGAVAVVVVLAANLAIVNHLNYTVDARLSQQLDQGTIAGATGPPAARTTQSGHGDDLDDAPSFLWDVTSAGKVTGSSTGAPGLPAHQWTAGQTTMSVAGSAFRLDAVSRGNGWLVAGESVSKIAQDRDDLLIAEAVLGTLLLLVTFGGSFIIGLRASAPIEQIRRRQAEFTADASHELRTPLSVIEAEVDLALSRERDAASYQDTLQRIGVESGRLHTIVEDLLWLARADGEPPTDRSGEVADVVAVGTECVDRFRVVADASSMTLTNRSDPATRGLVESDADSIDRLVSVLLDNACKYAGPGGTVELGVSVGGGQVTLAVEDSGPGIPHAHRAMVFDRFHRAADLPGGTGLGLAIADVVVRNSGGTWTIGTSGLGGALMQVVWPTVPDRPDGQSIRAASGSAAIQAT